jgi:hypothetical protein
MADDAIKRYRRMHSHRARVALLRRGTPISFARFVPTSTIAAAAIAIAPTPTPTSTSVRPYAFCTARASALRSDSVFRLSEDERRGCGERDGAFVGAGRCSDRKAPVEEAATDTSSHRYVLRQEL